MGLMDSCTPPVLLLCSQLDACRSSPAASQQCTPALKERHAGMLTPVVAVVQLAPSAASPPSKESSSQVPPGMSPMERFLAMDISAMAEAQAHAMEVSLMQPADFRLRPSMGMAVLCHDCSLRFGQVQAGQPAARLFYFWAKAVTHALL